MAPRFAELLVTVGAIAAFFALACTEGATRPATYEGCPDAPCRQAWLLEHFEAEPERVASRVREIVDPIEREVVVQGLSEAYPGQTQPLCKLLGGAGGRRCKTLNERPHLHVEPSDLPSISELSSSPRLFMDRLRQADLPNPWAEQTGQGVEIPCNTNPPSQACHIEAALVAVEKGSWSSAAGACGGVAADKWRHECFFQAAERALQHDGQEALQSHRVGPAMELCLAAGPYRSRCFMHLSNFVAERARIADRATAEDWRHMVRLIDAGATALEPLDPILASLWRHQVWAVVTWTAYRPVLEPTGDLLDHLPEELAPHVRSAVAMRVVAMDDGKSDLASLQARMAEALASRAEPGGGPLPASQTVVMPRSNWSENIGSEADLPQVPYLDFSRRSVHEDPAVDGLLALVEAAGHQAPPRTDLLREALRHEEAQVRWTAVRVLRVVDPGGRVRLPSEDPDPLVEGRLE